MPHRRFFERCLFLLLVFASCKGREERNVQRSFYYWKTVYRLSPKESETLERLSVRTLYVKFFDVDWDEAAAGAAPVAKVLFQEAPPKGVLITPVVFLTQEPLQKLDSIGLAKLATNINDLLSSISKNNGLSLSNEVQLDCDWTATTRSAYFSLLQRLKQQPFFQRKTFSATIRLHQLKFLSQNGVPPVDKGLLMVYNMGNLRSAKTGNSILEEAELKKYINTLPSYPLPLDVALPLFDWWVLFEGDAYKGLLLEFEPSEALTKKDRIYFSTDTVIGGYSFKAGQWLRHERSDAATVERCAALVSKKLKGRQVNAILYHLDERNLTNYASHELETFYNRFR